MTDAPDAPDAPEAPASPLYTAAQISELTGEPPETVRNWRRLPADHPRRLQSTLVDGVHLFHFAHVLDWLRRPEQAAMVEVILGAFAPPTRRAGLLGYIAPLDTDTPTTETTPQETE